MANYSLQIDTSNFKPYTFDDIIKPFLLYKEDYNKMQEKAEKYIDEYGDVILPIGANEKYLNIVNNYRENAQQAMEDFYQYGLNTRTGNALRKVFASSKGEMNRIKLGLAKYEEAKKSLEKLGAQALYDAPDVNEYLEGNGSMRYIDKQDVFKTTALIVKGMQNLKGDFTFKQASDQARGYLVATRGLNFTPEDVNALATKLYFNQNPGAQSQLEAVLQNVFDSYNGSSYSSEVLRNLIRTIQQGMLAGIDDDGAKLIGDNEYMSLSERNSNSLSWARLNKEPDERKLLIQMKNDEHYKRVLEGLEKEKWDEELTDESGNRIGIRKHWWDRNVGLYLTHDVPDKPDKKTTRARNSGSGQQGAPKGNGGNGSGGSGDQGSENAGGRRGS